MSHLILDLWHRHSRRLALKLVLPLLPRLLPLLPWLLQRKLLCLPGRLRQPLLPRLLPLQPLRWLQPVLVLMLCGDNDYVAAAAGAAATARAPADGGGGATIG